MKTFSARTLIDDILLIVRNNNISESEDMSRDQILSWIMQYKAYLSKKENDKDSLPQGTFLTINGDTREIIHNGDSELRIDKEILLNPQWYNFKKNFKVVQLFIHDPNNSLIANYNTPYQQDSLVIFFRYNFHYLLSKFTFLFPVCFEREITFCPLKGKKSYSRYATFFKYNDLGVL